jgi:hypothetical protein
MPQLTSLADGVAVASAPLRFLGLPIGTRMTALRLAGGVLLISPIPAEPALVEELAAFGPLRWVLAPNRFHHLHVGPWLAHGVEAWAAEGLPAKRPDLAFAGVVGQAPHPFGDEVELLPTRSFPLTNEVAVLHRPSRTLVLTDLVFNFGPDAPMSVKLGMGCLCGYPGFRATALEKLGMRRAPARQELAQILAWDFDRVIVAHGHVLETGGRQALAEAYRWLGLP